MFYLHHDNLLASGSGKKHEIRALRVFDGGERPDLPTDPSARIVLGENGFSHNLFQ